MCAKNKVNPYTNAYHYVTTTYDKLSSATFFVGVRYISQNIFKHKPRSGYCYSQSYPRRIPASLLPTDRLQDCFIFLPARRVFALYMYIYIFYFSFLSSQTRNNKQHFGRKVAFSYDKLSLYTLAVVVSVSHTILSFPFSLAASEKAMFTRRFFTVSRLIHVYRLLFSFLRRFRLRRPREIQ